MTHAAMAVACWSRSCRNSPSTSKAKGLEPKFTSTASFRLHVEEDTRQRAKYESGDGTSSHIGGTVNLPLLELVSMHLKTVM